MASSPEQEAPPEAISDQEPKNPRRVAAGRANRARRGPLTELGRERLRVAALRLRPWEHATGPRTARGKAQAVRNGKRRQQGRYSIRERRAELAAARLLLEGLRAARQALARP